MNSMPHRRAQGSAAAHGPLEAEALITDSVRPIIVRSGYCALGPVAGVRQAWHV